MTEKSARRDVLLLIGASRIAGLKFPGDEIYDCITKPYPGASLKKIAEEADGYLADHPEVKIVVMVALQCDLSERRRYMPNGGRGLASADAGS